MCEQTEIDYLDGDIVWVKLGNCWWPGEVVGADKLPPDVLPSFRKPPIAVVKFFNEDTFEYVKNLTSIYRYNCSRKNEFINKGLYLYRTKHGPMEKFPEDVIRAETAVGGDIKILTRDEFQETKKESYAGLFGDPAKKTPTAGKSGRGRPPDTSKLSTPMKKFKEKTNYKVHILLQGSKTPANDNISTPSTSRAGSEPSEVADKQEEPEKQTSVSTLSTPTMSSAGLYACHACQFTTTRLNVLILHNKSHSVTFTPYTPSPARKKQHKSPKSTPLSTKTSKQKKQRQEKIEKVSKRSTKSHSQKRSAEQDSIPEVKKAKTDEEIKSSLLADWDDGDDESNDESTMVMAGSPEVPVAAESPAVPTPAELPSPQVPAEELPTPEKKSDESDKPESSSDSNKYEFCEDEDWHIETDIGRKIPRVKNPSKRKGETKSVSIDEDEMAREVAELLNKTTLPELPSAPEPLRVEENFPEPTIAKSPDKKAEITAEPTISDEKKSLSDTQPPRTIFKTKTFFRSRHSRSQDAIGKYVAEQLNAAERINIADSEINGSELAPSPEIRISPPPIEHVKVARLAPKIQFKKIKAEAAQLRELEKNNSDRMKDEKLKDTTLSTSTFTTVAENLNTNENDVGKTKIDTDSLSDTNAEPVCNHLMNKEKSLLSLDYLDSSTRSEEEIKENLNKEIKQDNKEAMDKNLAIMKEAEVKTQVLPEGNIQKSYEPFMNESTASAVDALLSVSRDADRVTKVISDDLPEDLFEDDKDTNISNNTNGYGESNLKNNELIENQPITNNGNNNLDNMIENDSMNEDTINQQDDTHDIQSENVSEVVSTDISNIQNTSVGKNAKEVVSYDILSTEKNCTSTDPVSNSLNNFSLESIPSESDLQIAEALINLPTTTLQNKVSIGNQKEKNTIDSTSENAEIQSEENLFIQENEVDEDVDNATNVDSSISKSENTNTRFETEQEKSENLNAAQSLVQMSETIDHNIKMPDVDLLEKEHLSIGSGKAGEVNISMGEQKLEEQKSLLAKEVKTDNMLLTKCPELETKSPKLLKILEEPCLPKLAPTKKTITKQIIIPGKEKILNFDVGKVPVKAKPQLSKQKIIIRRTTPNKNLLNNITEVSSTPDKIILSRSNKFGQDGSSVQTYTIKTTPDQTQVGEKNTIIIQPKLRNIAKPVTKLQKIKPHQNTPVTENKTAQGTKGKDDGMFDINSMPIVISDEILTPESIEKMPIVMSDGNLKISNTNTLPKLVKSKQTVIESEKIPICMSPKPETKVLAINTNDGSKITTPNILSKSSKLRGTKHMLVFDKTTGKQKLIVAKTESIVKENKPIAIKESKPPQTNKPIPQTASKPEKIIILPTQNSPRPGRTQKIVIDPQTGKAHVLIGKGPETSTSVAENKPVSAKLASDANSPGNTVMIITNAQGAQSRIVLTPEHEKILFPNKQQPNVSQIKTFTNRVIANSGVVQKAIVSTPAATKTQTRIVPKQKNAIITSKGQLIVGGRIATTAQNIAPLPEIRPAPKRIIASEPKKLVQAIQKNSSEPLIFLQQKSGAVMQLTAAQFEHLQRTGQIIQKTPTPPQENKIIVQKSISIPPTEPAVSIVQKQRIRKHINISPTPPKKIKQEIPIAPAPVPALTPLSTIAPPQVPNISSTTSNAFSTNYSDLENLEELLPSTAIARQEPVIAQPEVSSQPPAAPLPDGQLLAVPIDFFGGPPGAFYLCLEENGAYNIVDNRPLVLENNQLVPMADPLPVFTPQPERRDILEAALANSEVFHAEPGRDEAPDFRDLNANVSVHSRVSETSTTLHQPIMTPVEVPTKVDSEPAVPSNLEDGLAVIGVSPHTVPTSLELPITVTDPRIAPKTTNPLTNNNYGATLLSSPNTEMTYVTREEVDVPVVGPISMPLLTDEEAGGKSMPILTDEVTERTVSSVESTIGSPSSIDVRESENEDGGQWSRRLLTPCSDTSETSTEIPLQPVMQLSVSDLSQNS